MDEKRYETVEIQIDAELLEQLKKVIAPMGLTPEMLAVQFFEFCVNPDVYKRQIFILRLVEIANIHSHIIVVFRKRTLAPDAPQPVAMLCHKGGSFRLILQQKMERGHNLLFCFLMRNGQLRHI